MIVQGLVWTGRLFIASLVLLLIALLLSMMSFVYQIGWSYQLAQGLEGLSVLGIGLSVLLGGIFGFSGMIAKSLGLWDMEAMGKAKNEEKQKRLHQEDVKGILNDLDDEEREQLQQLLAESRLAIRDDGILVSEEQLATEKRIQLTQKS